MGKKIDLTGQRFGKLLVVEGAGRDKHRKALWRCECQCGNVTLVTGNHLRHKTSPTRSCGKGECSYLYGRKGEAHPSWQGDAITYHGAHYRVYRLRGAASEHRCNDCGEQAQDWSLDCAYVDDPREEVNGYMMAFSPDPSRYEPRCRQCHRLRDRALARSRSAVADGASSLAVKAVAA